MKDSAVKAPILPKVPAGPTKISGSPSPGSSLVICNQCKRNFVNDSGSHAVGKTVTALGSLLTRLQGTQWGGLCPTALFMAQSHHGVRHGANLWGVQVRSGGWVASSYLCSVSKSWATPEHSLMHKELLAGISTFCFTEGREPPHSENQCPRILSGFTSLLGGIQVDAGDLLQWKGRLVSMGWGSEEIMSPVRSNLPETLLSLLTCTELLTKWLSSPSVLPPPAQRRSVASRREQRVLLWLPFPLGLVFCLNLSAFSFQPLVLVIQKD